VSAFLRNPPWRGSPPTLKGQQVYLRAPQLSDWSEWARLRAASRDFLTPWEPTWLEDELTRNAYRLRLRRYGRDARDGIGYAFFVFRREDDSLLGGITLSNVRRGVTQSCSIGYWMGQQYAGQGLMQDAVTTSLSYVFDELGLHRLEAACLPHNEASTTVLLKTGFQKEGHARKYLRINGKWSDHTLFAMLQSDRRE
jgi:ribosomal-protein-alanine N-acetyltransferase